MGTKANPSAWDCYANAKPDEPMFVLLGRDPMAEQLVLMWAKGAEMRSPDEVEKISEAKVCAAAMANYCRSLGKLPMRWNAAAPVITRAAPKTAITREQVQQLIARLVIVENRELVRELARAAGVPE